ncbi:chemotaxis protein CheW [Devosia sp.]|uniref:chemotaxis protein CheW n=1 Tax=Devosia sp. TaxID=1871048 RepID=UPI0025C5FE66|nr:chemotaxis protein CheW [Devosia sp.]
MSAFTEPMRALTLRLDDELFAIRAESVREILDLVPVTDVPNASPFAAGLINVRGRVVPLANLKVAFGMPEQAADQDTRIVVIETEIEGEPSIVGILADKVYDVTDIEPTAIEDAPRVGMRWRPDYVRGIGKRRGEFIIIPDMQRIFEIEGRTSGVAKPEERAAS